MKHLALAAAVLGVAALGSLAARSQDAPPPSKEPAPKDTSPPSKQPAPKDPSAKELPTRIGFVDVEKVVSEWKKREEVRKALQARSDALGVKFKGERTRIEEKEAKLATLNETSDEFLRLVREIDGDKFLHRRDQEYEKERLQKDEFRQVWGLYKAVVHEAQAVAEAKGLSCVLDWAPLTVEMDKAANPLSHVPKRTVVWADPRLDLTAEVLASLNAQMPPK